MKSSFIFILTLLAGSVCFSDQIKIAVQYPDTGLWNYLGHQAYQSAVIAADEVQESFRRQGHTVTVVPFVYRKDDDASQTASAKKIIDDPSILAAISYINVGFAEARVPLVTWNQRPQITASPQQNVTRIALADPIRQDLATGYISKKLKAKNTMILTDGSSFAKNYLDSLRSFSQKNNLVIKGEITLNDASAEAIAEVAQKIRREKITAIIFVGNGDQSILDLVQLKLTKEHMSLPIVCLVDYPPIKMREGVKYLYVYLFHSDIGKPSMTQLEKTFKTRYKDNMGGLGVYGYDSAKLIFSSLHKHSQAHMGKIPSRTDLHRAIRSAKIEGVTGLISFDQSGNRITGEFLVGLRDEVDFKVVHTGTWPTVF